MSTTFELCAERLTPRAMLASTHSRCNTRSPGATRQGGCCRIVQRPTRRHRAATSIVISRGSVARPISTGTGGSRVCGRFGTRYPAGAELNEIIS